MKALKTILALTMAVAISGGAMAANPLTDAVQNAKTDAKEAAQTLKTDSKSALNKGEDLLKSGKEKAQKAIKGDESKVSADKNAVENKLEKAKKTAEEKISKEEKAVKQKVEEKVESKKADAQQKVADKTSAAKDLKAAAGKKIDINSADQKTLEALPGIGEAKAKAIIEYREKMGKIKDLKELSNVSGVGQTTLEKIKPLIKF